MDLRKLKTLIDLVQNSGISELEISEGEEKIRIAKHMAPAAPTNEKMMINSPYGIAISKLMTNAIAAYIFATERTPSFLIRSVLILEVSCCDLKNSF